MAAIQTLHLTKHYRDVAAVTDLNLSIEAGELFALLGVNGAGKTTTIKMLSCLTKPTSGDALLLGESVVLSAKKVKETINLSPQETAVASNLSVRENLELICGIYGFDRRTTKKKVEQAIARFGFEEIAKRRAKTLSGGWQRRLSIAMALISDPHVLFLDEPTLGLDVLARRELWTLIASLKGDITMVLTTHYLEEAERLSDHIGVMAAGRLVAVGTAKQLMQKTQTDRFEDAFVALCTGGSGI